MKPGPLLAVIGVIIIVLGVLNHYALHIMSSTQHIDVYIAVLGVVVALAGIVMAMTGRNKAA
jgi:hypothetical protein